MATLEAYISRMTGVSVQALRDHAPLAIIPGAPVRYKKRCDCSEPEVAAAAAIAVQVARALVHAVEGVAEFKGLCPADAARRYILSKWTAPDLDALLDFAWDNGILVAHMAELPDASKKFDGLTMFANDRPVVILASGRDSPAWLTFHLAHELAHVLLGHVTPDSPMSELGLESETDDPQELEADRYALTVLTGDPDMTGTKLAEVAQNEGMSKRINPGVLALVYGRSAGRMPAAQNALNHLGLTSGAHDTVASSIRRNLREELPETVRMLVRLVTEA